ncbi:MAG: RidA family protein [Acidobacteriota bacterium]
MSVENRSAVATPKAPAAIGPYSQAMGVGDFLFVSGQIALDPETGRLGNGGTIEAETERVMENLKAILVAGGSSLAQVVKTTIYLADLGDFQAVNQMYGRYFPENPPARATIQVAGLPMGARVEVEAVAFRG